MHLIIDGYGGDSRKMQDTDLIYQILDRYPSQIKMTKISPPYVFRNTASKGEDWVVSGFVLLAESHISIHTFPGHSYAVIDIFSCKEFSPDQVVNSFKESLGLDEVKSYVLSRPQPDSIE